MVIDIAIFAIMAYFYAPFRGEPEANGTASREAIISEGHSANGHSKSSMQMEPIKNGENGKRKGVEWDE